MLSYFCNRSVFQNCATVRETAPEAQSAVAASVILHGFITFFVCLIHSNFLLMISWQCLPVLCNLSFYSLQTITLQVHLKSRTFSIFCIKEMRHGYLYNKKKFLKCSICLLLPFAITKILASLQTSDAKKSGQRVYIHGHINRLKTISLL